MGEGHYYQLHPYKWSEMRGQGMGGSWDLFRDGIRYSPRFNFFRIS